MRTVGSFLRRVRSLSSNRTSQSSLCSSEASSFPFHLKVMDVMRLTDTDSASAAEHSIDDGWNIDGAGTVSDDVVNGRQTKIPNTIGLGFFFGRSMVDLSTEQKTARD